jgi:hypothetical protein
MTSCTGPYTRVFFDARDARALDGLARALAADGWRTERVTLPDGRGGIDDLSCEMTFADGWTVRAAKFLGPRGLLKRRHVYELDVTPPAGADRRHFFGPDLGDLIARFLDNRAALADGAPVAAAVDGADAHERRIELCNGL